ncbi:MAG: hypothetical protein ABII25_03150 [bacterium]
MLKVLIMSPNKVFFNGSARSIIIPGVDGFFEIMDFHCPLISLTVMGGVQVDNKRIMVRKGVVKVERNEVVVLVE